MSATPRARPRKQAAPSRFVPPSSTLKKKRALRGAAESASKRRLSDAERSDLLQDERTLAEEDAAPQDLLQREEDAASADEAQSSALLAMPDLVLCHIFPLRTRDPIAARDRRATLKRFALTCRAAYMWAWHERFRDATSVTIAFGVPPIFLCGTERAAFDAGLAVRSAVTRPLRLACPRVSTVVFDTRELGRCPTIATWEAMQKLMSLYLRTALPATQHVELSVLGLPRGRFLPLRFPARCLVSFRPSSVALQKNIEYVTMPCRGRLDACSPIIQSFGGLVFGASPHKYTAFAELRLTSRSMQRLLCFMFSKPELHLRVERMVLTLDNDDYIMWESTKTLTVHTLVTHIPDLMQSELRSEPHGALSQALCCCYQALRWQRCAEWLLVVDEADDIEPVEECLRTRHNATGFAFREETQADGSVMWRCCVDDS